MSVLVFELEKEELFCPNYGESINLDTKIQVFKKLSYLIINIKREITLGEI